MMGRFYNADLWSLTPEPSCKSNVAPDLNEAYPAQGNEKVGGASSSSAALQFNEIADRDFETSSFRCGGGVCTAASGRGGEVPSSLTTHSNPPAGLHAFSITKEIGRYSSQINGGLKSQQLSFPSRKESLSEINKRGFGGYSSASKSFPVGSSNDTNSIFFANPSNRRAKIVDDNIVTGLDCLNTQFSLSRSSSEMASVAKYLYMNHDPPVQCGVRAKRGFATHPRSIAERERRTKISEKLKKLEELVPNMDKQTSTAEMLELAVQHIKSLQSQVQKLNKIIQKCTCGCEQEKYHFLQREDEKHSLHYSNQVEEGTSGTCLQSYRRN